jgi:hypothetical protein
VVGCALAPSDALVMSKCVPGLAPRVLWLLPPLCISPTGKPPCLTAACWTQVGSLGNHARFRQLGSAMLSMPMLMPLPMSDKMSLRRCGTNLFPANQPTDLLGK